MLLNLAILYVLLYFSTFFLIALAEESPANSLKSSRNSMSSVSMLQKIQGLEMKLGLPIDVDESLVNRVQAIEMKVFAEKRTGAISDRINALLKVVKNIPIVHETELLRPVLTDEESQNREKNRQTDKTKLDVSSENRITPRPVIEKLNEQPLEPSLEKPIEQALVKPVEHASEKPAEKALEKPLEETKANIGILGDTMPLLNAFPVNLVRVEPDETALEVRPDYYQEIKKASKGKTIRFKSMPIPVYVQAFPDKSFVDSVVKAFESWETRTNGTVRFAQVSASELARICVTWKHLGTRNDADGCMLGAHTILKYTDRGNGSLALLNVGTIPVPLYMPRVGPKYSVPPQLMEVNLDLIMSKDPSIRYRCLQNIVTHELGHALGLLGHSPYVADIMYPVTDEHSRLSQRDINTLMRLYSNKVELPL